MSDIFISYANEDQSRVEPLVSIKEICGLLKISRSTLYRYVAPEGTIRKTKGS